MEERRLFPPLPLIAQVISVLGFPIVVAGFFLLKDIGVFSQIPDASAGMLETLNNQHKTTLSQLDELIRVAREICKHSAKNQVDVAKCFEP